VVYDPIIHGRRYLFGVSGRLYQRNALFYDHETESLWSQLLSEAVTGPMTGTHLKVLSAENTTWEAWKARHPNTLVLSFNTGYSRDYSRDPYAGWKFPRRPALLVSVGNVKKIYPYFELKKASGGLVKDRFGGQTIRIIYDDRSQGARVNEEGKNVTWFASFLDDLRNFYPKAEVYHAP